MHVYKDSIISKDESLEMTRLVKKAVIVHPNSEENISYGTHDDFIKKIYLSPIENTDSEETIKVMTHIKEILSDKLIDRMVVLSTAV